MSLNDRSLSLPCSSNFALFSGGNRSRGSSSGQKVGWRAEESGHGDAMLTKSCKFLEGEATGGDAGRVIWGETGCWDLREGGLGGLGC